MLCSTTTERVVLAARPKGLATLASKPMRKAWFSLLLPAALSAGLAGCGRGGSRAPLRANGLPLVAGARVVAQARQCDRGANPFCALELVAVNPRYRSSGDFVVAERRRLHALGWSLVGAQAAGERAAESPGHKLRVTYSTAISDLQQIELGLIRRAHTIELALSQTLLVGTPAISLMLEDGPA